MSHRPVPWESVFAILRDRPGDQDNRSRLPEDVLAWCRKASRVAAHLTHVCRVFRGGSRAGGHGGPKTGECFAERIARADRGLLDDLLAAAEDMLTDIREEIAASLESSEPTTAVPGSREKIAVMESRARAGRSPFNPADSLGPPASSAAR